MKHKKSYQMVAKWRLLLDIMLVIMLGIILDIAHPVYRFSLSRLKLFN